MQVSQSQIKLNIPLPLKELLFLKSERLGLPMASYIRHLIIQDVIDVEFPERLASSKTENQYKKAMKEKNKAVKVTGDIGEFLDNL